MNRNIRVLGLAAFMAAMLIPALAAAQAPPRTQAPAAPNSEQRDPKACAQSGATVGSGGSVDAQKQPGDTLSDKLAQSGGVICPPPGVDPEINEPTPPGGPMPVIPPPGSPGGNPNVQPK
jgi:hypothetical protein